MLKIVLKLKNTEMKTLETDSDEITIGRNKNNDIQIDNLGVSKKHARIVRSNGIYMIEDLQSTNGTFLNSERITKAALTGKDLVTIGKHTLLISTQEGRSDTQGFSEPTIKL